MVPLLALAGVLGLIARPGLAQGNAPPSAPTTSASGTTSAGLSQITSEAQLKLAKSYSGSSFWDEWEWFTDADPTGGYVNYVSKNDAQSLGLADARADGQFIMRVDAENRSVGRGRNSVRIVSKAEFADGVYILDMNHMPVGCGTWPAFWTVVKDGWPDGGEIDIIEGANAYPQLYSASYNATLTAGLQTNVTTGYPLLSNVASLHTESNCQIPGDSYMSGTIGSTTCSAYMNGNMGCGAILPGKSLYGVDSFGAGVNQVGGGWYALWRDMEGSGGVYTYFWPRDSQTVPDDVRYPNTTVTNVANWGEPAANLSAPGCRSDFGNHVIVLNIALCGDYAGATYAQAGCPNVCSSFTQNNPAAFGEAYWSINNVRVYNRDGAAAHGDGLSKGAIAGIAVGAVVALVLIGVLVWWWRRRRADRARALAQPNFFDVEPNDANKNTGWVGLDTNPTASRETLGAAPSLSSQPVGGSPASRRSSKAAARHLAFATGSTSALGTASATGSGASTPRKQSVAVLEDNEEDVLNEGVKRSRRKTKHEIRIATMKPRTGPTLLKPGMTAKNYLEGETPIAPRGGLGPVQLEHRSQQPNSWVG